MAGLWKAIFDPVEPPDPYQVAASQAAANQQTAQSNVVLNNPNTVTPYGTTTWQQIGTNAVPGLNGGTTNVPRYQRTDTLNPADQAILDKQRGIKAGLGDLIGGQIGRLGSVLGAPIDYGGMPSRGNLPTSGPQFQGLRQGPNLTNLTNRGLPIQMGLNLGEVNPNVNLGRANTAFANTGSVDQTVGPQDWSKDRLRVEQAIRTRANPQLEQRGRALDAQLEAQGFRRGTAAFNAARDEHNRSLNDFELATIGAGGQEQDRLARLAFQQFGLEGDANQRAYNQALGRGTFGRESIAQNNLARLGEFGANLQGTALNNQARGQEGAFANAAQAAAFGQRGQMVGANNAVAQQEAQNAWNRTMYGNDIAQRGFGNTTNLAQLQDQQRQMAINEMLGQRNQSINEITAALSGTQLQPQPSIPFTAGRISDTPLSQNVYASNALAAQQQNAALGGLFGLAGTGIQAGMMYGPQAAAGQPQTNWFGMTRA